ncbi:hypothetical protein N431DRAFT_485162 [Stipitochalara longipes BDJ]|nr:hypothetical protein N431DRAFT_485162 [Stipitochalara longipes BDJ]
MYLSVETLESWPTPNYVNPETRGPGVIYINSILYSLVVAVVGMRTYTRLFISRSFGLDDTFILIAMLPTTTFVAIMLVAQLRDGWNRHEWDILPDTVATSLKFSLTSQILFAVASTCTRLSMLFLTRRILSNGNPRLEKFIIFAIAFMATDCCIFITVAIFQCRPISAYWTLSLVPQRCLDQKIHLVVQGTLNIIYDFCVVLIPIPVVLGLNLALRQRIIVALLFGAGFVVCIAGTARTYFMYRCTDGYHDITWDGYPVWIATAIELYVGIVCASFPPTKPFFARYMPKLLSGNSQYTRTHSIRNRSPQPSSGKSITVNRSVHSRDREGSAGMEFEEFPGRIDKTEKSSRTHKRFEISQDWSWLNFSSSGTSVVPLAHSASTAEDG